MRNRINTNTYRTETRVDSLVALLDDFIDAFNILEDLRDRDKANAKKHSTESGILTKIKKFFKAKYIITEESALSSSTIM